MAMHMTRHGTQTAWKMELAAAAAAVTVAPPAPAPAPPAAGSGRALFAQATGNRRQLLIIRGFAIWAYSRLFNIAVLQNVAFII